MELIARHNLNNASMEPFCPSHILCVSEVGLPVPNVRAMVDEVRSHFGIEVWRGEGDKEFAVVGHEEHLDVSGVPYRIEQRIF